MARYRAQHPPKAKPPEHDAPTAPEEALLEGEVIAPHTAAEAKHNLNFAPDTPSSSYTPPPGSPEAALLEGDLLTPGKTPQVVHEPPPQHTAPPPVDLAAWKRQDYAHMTHAHEVAQHLPTPDVPTIGPAPATIGSAEENPLEDEARTQAQGVYYFTKAIAWLKMLTEVPWIKRLVGVSEYSAARAANPFPVGDAALGALEQLMDDERRPKKLAWWQRLGRVGVKAFESFFTGVASDEILAIGGSAGAAAGGAAEPVGGEFLGLPIGIVVYIGSSLWLDKIVWPSFNERNLGFLGEWQDDAP